MKLELSGCQIAPALSTLKWKYIAMNLKRIQKNYENVTSLVVK